MSPVPWMRHKPDVPSIMECPCRKKKKRKKMKDRKYETHTKEQKMEI